MTNGGPGITVRMVDTGGTPANRAVMVTWVGPATGPAATLKVAEVAPVGTKTLDGTWAAAGVSLVSATVIPPRNAGPLRVRVPVKVCPLENVWVLGRVITKDLMVGEGDAVTDNAPVLENPLSVVVARPVVKVATGKAVHGTLTR